MTRAGAICGAASPSPALRPRLMLASDEMARGARAAGARAAGARLQRLICDSNHK